MSNRDSGPRVDDLDPPHQLVVSSRRMRAAGSGEVDRLLITFVAGAGFGPVRREWAEREIVVSGPLARMLALLAGRTMVERAMTLFVGAEPVLTSSSHLPPDLTGDPEGWRNVRVGQLALAGRLARSTYLAERSRIPTLAEAEALGMDRAVPVLVLAHRYEVPAPAGSTTPAGVLVVARSDRVYLRHESLP